MAILSSEQFKALRAEAILCNNCDSFLDATPTTRDVRSGSTIGFCKERAVVVAQGVCARTRGSELSTYPVRWRLTLPFRRPNPILAPSVTDQRRARPPEVALRSIHPSALAR